MRQTTTSSLTVKILTVGQLATNCYLIADKRSRQTLIVDPGDDAEYIKTKVQDERFKPQAIVASHGHFDHLLAALEIQLVYRIPFYLHKNDEFLVSRMRQSAAYFLHHEVPEQPPRIDGFLYHGQKLTLGDVEGSVVATPGHTPGSVCFYFQTEHTLFTGDTVFAHGGVGRTDFSYSSAEDLNRSIKIILDYPPETKLYPGHGEESTIARELHLPRR